MSARVSGNALAPAVLVRERTLVGVPPTDAEVEHLVDEVVLTAWRARPRGAQR